MKRTSLYTPIAIIILFGLAINVIASSPIVYGDNLAGCQGAGNSTAKVILAGRVITPSTLLRSASGQPCGSNETGLNLVSMTRTVIVSPNGIPSQNGAALLSAMTTISNASPSASNPWLLKLEPGNYDLGSGSLTLKPYVDLEGSGEGTTTISSAIGSTTLTGTTGTLVMASNSEARFVKIINNGLGSNYNAAILVRSGTSNVRVTHVTTYVASSDHNYGIFNNGGTFDLLNSTIEAAGGYAYGLMNNGGTGNLLNSTFNASCGICYGVYNTGNGIVNIQNSGLFSAGEDGGYGLYVDNGSGTVKNSILSGASTFNGYGVYQVGGSVGIGASQVSGSSGLAYGAVTCAASYNTSYAALNSSCA